jgi:hypothetical protein
MPTTTISPTTATACAGIIRLAHQPDEPTRTRRQYDAIFIRAGRVRRVDGSDSNWLIPSEPLQAAVALFDGIAVYADHPEMFGFGWRQSPHTDRLIGITSNPSWDKELKAIVGTITLYDENPSSLGAIMGDLWDQMLSDQKEGNPAPQAGLSATLWQNTNLDEDSGITATTEITQVDSVDFVYSPGAGGFIRAALSAIRANYPGFDHNLEESNAINQALAEGRHYHGPPGNAMHTC